MIKEGPAIEYVIKRIKDPNIAFAAVTNIHGVLKQYAQKGFTTITDLVFSNNMLLRDS